MLEEADRVRVKTVEIIYLLCSSVLLFINTSKVCKVTHAGEKKFMNKMLSVRIQLVIRFVETNDTICRIYLTIVS